MALGYLMSSVIAFICLSLYYFKPKKYKKVAYGVSMYIIIRTCIRLFDFENTRTTHIDESKWLFKVVYQMSSLMVHTTVFFSCSPATKLHLVVTMLLCLLIVLSLMCGIHTTKLMIEDPSSFFQKSPGFLI